MIKPTATLATERLLLRQWQPSDLPAFAEMNADSEVMQYFPKVLSKQTSNLIANKCQQLIEDTAGGFGPLVLKRVLLIPLLAWWG